MIFAKPWLDALIVLLVVLLFFGPKRLPALGKSLGEGMREFKDSITGNSSDDESEGERTELNESSAAPSASTAPPAAQPAPPPSPPSAQAPPAAPAEPPASPPPAEPAAAVSPPPAEPAATVSPQPESAPVASSEPSS